ncbi:hypothetical protein JOB18_022856 [Solea senegalensis]|uniref:Uncharacterized protein n=1 Tax=Solea senegalensis TaxID=28829 RepID=A0AAV6PUJ6_SOLSE|nr:hypothetical protein JOB18_022856 [Solea senegalensis]
MMRSAHSSTIVGSSPALKCRCDTGDQSAARSRRTATYYREVINRASQTALHPPPPSSAAPSIIKDSGRKNITFHKFKLGKIKDDDDDDVCLR